MGEEIEEQIVVQDEELHENNMYVNGFSVAYGNSDTVLKFTRNGQHVLTMNMSFTLAKTLSQILGTTVQSIESNVGMDIKTTRDFDLAITQVIEADSEQ